MQSWDSTIPGPDPARKSSVSSSSTAKPHRRFFSLGRSQTQPTEEETTAIPPNLLSTLKSLDAGPNDIKTINRLLTKLPGDKLRSTLVTALKQDHPDALCLRFIRAEKWNIPKAWIKLVSALNWRANEYKVDEEVLLKGEEYHIEKSRQSGDPAEKKDSQGFVHQLKTGKGHFHGADKWGRPICIVRARTHNPSDQTLKGLNDYIIHCIETVRFLQVPPVETMVSPADLDITGTICDVLCAAILTFCFNQAIVFDLTSFSLSNWVSMISFGISSMILS
jgi:CRAL/TRIO, N-terminus.